MKYIISLILIVNFGFAFSQEMNEFEMESRKKADLVFEKSTESESENLPYLMIGSGNQNYLIIIYRKTHFAQIKARIDSDDNIEIETTKSIKSTNKVLVKAFDKSIYKNDFVGFQSDFFKDGYELAIGATTYFVMKDKERNRYGESCLSVIVKPNPINVEIYNYLIRKLVSE